MNEKELYQKKMHVYLDEWKADIQKLKARASKMNADTKIEIHKNVELLQSHITKAKTKMLALTKASDNNWLQIKEGMESSWKITKAAFDEAENKFKHKEDP